MIVVGLGSLCAHILRKQPREQTLFNTAELMLQAGIGGLLLAGAGWTVDAQLISNPALLLFVIVIAAIMYVIEYLSVAIVAGLQTGTSPLLLWRQSISFDSIEVFAQYALGLVAALLVVVQPWALVVLLLPAIALYRSSKRHLQLRDQARILEYRAFHDALTGLPNRALFADRLTHALTRTDRNHALVAVLFLDLDRFKVINDSLGHEIGDQVLLAVADRLKACLRPSDTVARLGGDEFTILLEDIDQVRDATQVAERIAETLKTPFQLSGHEATTTASIGLRSVASMPSNQMTCCATPTPRCIARRNAARRATKSSTRA